MKRMVHLIKELCNEIETVNEFCHLRDWLKVSGDCVAVGCAAAKVRISGVRLKKCGELFCPSMLHLQYAVGMQSFAKLLSIWCF